jgi:NADH dehydrogenase FAD-containing subunit
MRLPEKIFIVMTVCAVRGGDDIFGDVIGVFTEDQEERAKQAVVAIQSGKWLPKNLHDFDDIVILQRTLNDYRNDWPLPEDE